MVRRYANLHLGTVVRGVLAVFAAGLFTLLTWPLFPAEAVVQSALHPAVIAGSCWAGQLWYGTRLSVARPLRAAVDDLAGMANVVTVARGGLYAVVAGFVVVPAGTTLAWIPAVCYGLGVCLDRLDGVVARTVGSETRVGARLDMAVDSFGFVAAPLLAVLWGHLPVWYLSLSALRYVYRAGLDYRRSRGRPVYERPDSDLGKYLAGVQMAFLTVALVPVVPRWLVWTAAPAVLAPSIGVFARDFLVASGRLGPRPTDREN